MRINHNISALNANNQLGKVTSSLDKSIQKLSSGKKINKASDDAAGLAISQKMQAQVKGLEIASRNSADGVSLIQTAEGAMTEIQSMVNRMRELAVQTSNGTYDEVDRAAVQDEIKQLNDEITRISKTYEFNGRTLLNGDLNNKAFTNDMKKVGINFVTPDVDPGQYSITFETDATQAIIPGRGATAGTPAMTALPKSMEGTIYINNEKIELKEGDTAEIVWNKIYSVCERAGINVYPYVGQSTATPPVPTNPSPATPGLEASAGYTPTGAPYKFGDDLLFVTEAYGSKEKLEISCTNPDLTAALGLPTGAAASKNGTNAVATINRGDYTNTTHVTMDGNKATIYDKNGFEIEFESKPYARTQHGGPLLSTLTVLGTGPITIQAGPNENQTLDLKIPAVTPENLGLHDINLKTQLGAQKALTTIDKAVNRVSEIRSRLGAYQNRLEHTIASTDVAAENMTSSLAQIEDTDMATEMSKYTQQNVINQAAVTMLAKANQRPEAILQLIQQ